MSADPMTMAIIANTAFQVAGTYSEIQDASIKHLFKKLNMRMNKKWQS